MKYGLRTKAVVASPLPGPSGNVEYFLWLVKDGAAVSPSMGAEADYTGLDEMIATAIKEGPQ